MSVNPKKYRKIFKSVQRADGGIDTGRFYAALKSSLASVKGGVLVESFPLVYKPTHQYEFLRLSSKDLTRGDRLMIVGAGVHANEIAGPLAMLFLLEHFFAYARERGVKIIAYPLRNPSGVELLGISPDQRYNLLKDDGSDQIGNNDFMRYEISDGEFVDDLGNSYDYRRWWWSSDIPSTRLPLETRIMHRCVRELDLKTEPLVFAIHDMHQDYITPRSDLPGNGSATYAYASEREHSFYCPVIDRVRATGINILKNQTIGAGYAPGKEMTTNELGIIVRYDGSWPDAMSRAGARYAITSETTGATPLELAVEVAKIWTEGLIDLVAEI